MKRSKNILLIAGVIIFGMAVSACAKSSAGGSGNTFNAATQGGGATLPAGTQNNGEYGQKPAVTLEQAKEIAAKHAGVSLADAVFSEEKFDDGAYELEFRDVNGKYEYEISAADGQILDYEWEAKNTAVTVTLEQAKEIAAEHAGVSLADAVFSEEKLDDGVYELEFIYAGGKYEYEISAADGQILDYEWEIKNGRKQG